jgi:ketosteroid isomerase-like protein
MTDSPNVAVVRRAFDAFTLRDVERLVATCSPDVEFHLPTARLARTGQPYRGHEGVRTYMRDAARVWSELRLEAREFHEAGDLVVAVGRVYAWGDGRVVDTPSAWVWRVADGLVLRVEVFARRSAAFAAAGMPAP